jgi:hypothetical protein
MNSPLVNSFLKSLKSLEALKTLRIIAVAAVCLFTGCDKEDFTEACFSEQVTISITANGFDSGAPETRASENGYVTSFVSGDKIGILVITADGNIVENNIPYRYNGTVWTPDGANTIHRYSSGTTYLAYYPYSSTMNGKKTAAEIIAAFTPNGDQSVYAGYTASDLMTGTGTVSSATLNITLTHALALVEIHLKKEKESASLTQPAFSIGGSSVKPYAIATGVYRYLVKPGETTIGGTYIIGGKTIRYSQTVTMESGKYTRLDVNN